MAKRMDYDLKVVLQFKGKPYVGQVDYKKKLITIALRGGITGRQLTLTEIWQTYYHEVVHAVLHDMKHPLNNNEKFVDDFAKRLRWRGELIENQKAKANHAANLVTQRPEGLRELRKKVSRSKSSKKAQAK